MRFSIFAAPVAAILLCPPMSRAEESDATVPTYHADEARSGHYVVPGLTWARAAHFKRDPAFDGHVSGNVYAQPLYWRPAGAGRGLVIVATEDNVVVALDAFSGTTVWQSRLGPAVPLSKLECGNIDPLGVTGTPVIDERKDALYLDAMVDGNKGPRHLVFGLSLADGAVLPGWPVDTADTLLAIVCRRRSRSFMSRTSPFDLSRVTNHRQTGICVVKNNCPGRLTMQSTRSASMIARLISPSPDCWLDREPLASTKPA